MINEIAQAEYDSYGRMKFHPAYHENQGTVWNEEDIAYLIEWYSKIGVKEMSMALGRTEGTIVMKVYVLRNKGKMPCDESRNKKLSRTPTKVVQDSTAKNTTPLYHESRGVQVG